MALCPATKFHVPDHQRGRVPNATEDIRHRALARLYERRLAVDSLIHALERYEQEAQSSRPAMSPAPIAGEMS